MALDAIASRHISVSSRSAVARSDRGDDPANAPRNSGGRRGGSAPFVLDPCRKTPDWALNSSAGSSLSVGGRDLSPPGLSHSVRGAPLLLGGGGGALPADQIGWRPAADEQAARHQTFRQWARERTGRTDLQDEGGTVLGADIVPGMWTCCRNLDPAAGGCVLTEHCLGDEPSEEMPCDRCGAWVPLGRWDVDKCWHHPGVLCRGRWGGHTWECCGASGVGGTKAALLKPGAWLQRRRDEEERRLERRAGGVPRALPGPRWIDETSGCALVDRHSFELDRHLPHGADGLPLRPACGACGAAARVGQQRCDGCGADQRVCVQCFKAVLGSDVAAARASNLPSSCRFHPGTFCEALAVRYASKQSKTVHCPNRGCGYAALSKTELATHAKLCPYFEFDCEHGCGARLLRRSAAAHLAECGRLPMLCGAGCGRDVPREEMPAHRDYFCPAQPVPCGHAGCDATPPRAELAAHEAACPHAMVFCVRDCGACAPAGRWKGQAAHDVACPELPLPCAGCGGHQPRRRMERHVTVECPATLLRCGRCLMLTPRAGHPAHNRECLLRSVLAAWRESVAGGRTMDCPHSGGSGDAGGCTFRAGETEMRAHLDAGCVFAAPQILFQPSRARVRASPQLPLELSPHPPHCLKCGAPTAMDGTEVVVRVASLTPALISCLEIDRDGRSRTYGDEVTVKRVGVRLQLEKVAREAHADRCPMATARCTHCLRELKRMDMPAHEARCDERKRPCARKCGALIAIRNEQAHARVCANVPHACPYGCGKKLPLRHLTFRSVVGAVAGGTAGHLIGDRAGWEPTSQAKEAAWTLGDSAKATSGAGAVRRTSRQSAPADAGGALLCEPCDPEPSGRKAQARQQSAGALPLPRRSGATPPPRALSPPHSAVVRPEPELHTSHARPLLLKLLGRLLLPPLNATPGTTASPQLVPTDQLLASAHLRFLALVFVTGGDRQLPALLGQLARLMKSRPAIRVVLVPLGASEAEADISRAAVPSAFCLPPLGAANEQIGCDYGARRGTRMVLLHIADLGLACFDAARALHADPGGQAFPWAGQTHLSDHAARCPRYWHACPNARCTFSGVRAKLDAHMVSCAWRMLPCRRGCGAVLVVSAHKEHNLLCPKRPAQCSRSCGVSVTAGEIDSGEHDAVCPLKVLGGQVAGAAGRRRSASSGPARRTPGFGR